MKPVHFKLVLVASLVALSTGLFFLQYFIFHDPRDTFFYILQDIAFLPVQVLLVTLVLERLIRYNEKQARLNKQNMVIGAFFSQTGVALLELFSRWDPQIDTVRKDLVLNNIRSDEQFRSVYSRFISYRSKIPSGKVDFGLLKAKIAGERGFLLGLLENQNLLEHERFTDLLWATFHLIEELMCRSDLSHLSKPDKDHLAGDVDRAYSLLIGQWILYMQHLKTNYPYLFSLAVRTNPFDANARVELQ